MVALGAKALADKGVFGGDNGILGGPVALAALQSDARATALNIVIASGDPAGSLSQSLSGSQDLDLSTGSLDGSRPLQISLAQEEVSDISLVEKNAKAIESAVALEKSEPAEKKPQERYFIQPASGKNWGVAHAYNAVDIANSCGTSVIAAAAGSVVSDPSFGTGASGWNAGFGKFILIKHPNGSKTRYAHLSKIYVGVGETVTQGQEIGEIGNTGRVEGITGCHLHFEVIGAENPFIR